MENAVSRTDLDGQLWGLELDISREVNLRKDRKEFGARLIQIRALLQQKNGVKAGQAGADGLCPLGWWDWLRNNGIPASVAASAVRLAAGKLSYSDKHKHTGDKKFHDCVTGVIKNWKDASEDEKRRLSVFMRERALEERGGLHVVG